ncbi:MAG: ABC transporter permease [Spirochaetia bacterium]|jgi:ribose transport system permease protein
MSLILKKILRMPGVGVVGMLVLIYVLMLIFRPLPFLTIDNQFNILRGTSVLAIVCIGMTAVIIGRGIDLSVGSITGLSGGVCAFMLLNGSGLPLAILAALVTGIAIGALNGFLITKFGLGDFIVTLGTLYLFRGIYLAWAKGLPFIGYMNDQIWWIASGRMLGVPVPLVADIVLIFVFWFILRATQFGSDVFATGSNATAAEMVGVKTTSVKMFTYIISGLMCAIAGILLMARLTSVTPHTGEGLEMNAIGAVLLGGTSLLGGRGSVFGSILGAVLVSVVSNLVTILGIQPFLLQTVVGIIILIAVGLDVISRRLAVIHTSVAPTAEKTQKAES